MAFSMRCTKCNVSYVSGEDHECRVVGVDPASGENSATYVEMTHKPDGTIKVERVLTVPQVCPTCGHRRAMTAAERVRKHRKA